MKNIPFKTAYNDFKDIFFRKLFYGHKIDETIFSVSSSVITKK